jgi:predicted patatin/cPLA2 family phospholipase
MGFVFTYTTVAKYVNNKRQLKLEIQNNKQRIISSRNKKSYYDNQSIFINNDIHEKVVNKDKKLITISPGGCKGFYLLGILTFLKENYNMDNYIYSGASAGAWNALFMSYKGDTMSFAYNLLDMDTKKIKNLVELQYLLKYKMLTKYKTEDFDLHKIYIGVTTFRNFSPYINIYTDFDDLEDALNCCIASSHIPLVTGGITNRYKNLFSFDGGFSEYPYLNMERTLHISHSMWSKINKGKQPSNFIKSSMESFTRFSEFFSMSKNNLIELFDNGYYDAKINKAYFDNILDKKINDDIIEF